MKLTILMPCRNEEKTIAASIAEAQKYITESSIDAEILISDNISSDRSAEIAVMCGARVISSSPGGYGHALIAGINAARGDYILMGDCDMSYDFYHIGGFIEKLDEGCSLVMGNRFRGGIEHGAMPFSHRFIGVPALTLIGNIVYRTHLGDYHCGLRAFRRRDALSLGLCCGGMEFASELIGRFSRAGYPICEIPTVLRRDRRGKKGHLRTVRDGFRHLTFMLNGRI
ncbi:MAG: glycosyltransferase family 2 protein [Eubacteriales bacterium]